MIGTPEEGAPPLAPDAAVALEPCAAGSPSLGAPAGGRAAWEPNGRLGGGSDPIKARMVVTSEWRTEKSDRRAAMELVRSVMLRDWAMTLLEKWRSDCVSCSLVMVGRAAETPADADGAIKAVVVVVERTGSAAVGGMAAEGFRAGGGGAPDIADTRLIGIRSLPRIGLRLYECEGDERGRRRRPRRCLGAVVAGLRGRGG